MNIMQRENHRVDTQETVLFLCCVSKYNPLLKFQRLLSLPSESDTSLMYDDSIRIFAK